MGMKERTKARLRALETELADARTEIEGLNRILKNGVECFMSPCEKLDEKDKLIEQMRQALRLANAHICYKEAKEIIKAALEAAERNNKNGNNRRKNNTSLLD